MQDYHPSYMVFLFPPPPRKYDVIVLKDTENEKDNVCMSLFWRPNSKHTFLESLFISLSQSMLYR